MHIRVRIMFIFCSANSYRNSSPVLVIKHLFSQNYLSSHENRLFAVNCINKCVCELIKSSVSVAPVKILIMRPKEFVKRWDGIYDLLTAGRTCFSCVTNFDISQLKISSSTTLYFDYFKFLNTCSTYVSES